MKTRYFSIPGIIDLTKEKGWKSIGNKDAEFFIFRTHFAIKEHSIEAGTKKGEIIRAIEKPEHISLKRTTTIEMSQEQISVEELFKQSSLEKEVINEILSDLSIASDPNGSFSAKFKTAIQNEYKERIACKYCEYIKKTYTTRRVNTTKREIEVAFDKDYPCKCYYVNVYQHYAYDIYMVGIDYLYVKYERSLLGIRRKRIKEPRIIEGSKFNYYYLKIPLVSMTFWKHLPESTVIVPQDEYVKEVEDPDEIGYVPLAPVPFDKHFDMELSPSLYRIANAAFPFKWVNRKGSEWSKEELMKLEEEDYKEWHIFQKLKNKEGENG
ncbi:hypothetical protein [uncultured Bacteroides sp.]|uniref:hypothetical protein n=1 Tax=uncultured Bacteroides sp. TaxID=162156 RepID=UPI0025FD91D3|nr:hypothetical protein [uncultured Bacteroides sp.]